MVILGVHCGHNSSAALIVDGTIVGALQEECFTKRKNRVAFPAKAISHLIRVHLDGDVGRANQVATADAARTLALSGLEVLALPEDRLLFKKASVARITSILAGG